MHKKSILAVLLVSGFCITGVFAQDSSGLKRAKQKTLEEYSNGSTHAVNCFARGAMVSFLGYHIGKYVFERHNHRLATAAFATSIDFGLDYYLNGDESINNTIAHAAGSATTILAYIVANTDFTKIGTSSATTTKD